MLTNLISDIKLAMQNKAFYSALALTLTLPDMLGRIEYEQMKKREKYVTWFDTWVYPRYDYPKSKNEDIQKGVEATKFDGNNCYALRCAFLHAGNLDLTYHTGKIDVFELFVNDDGSEYGDTYVCDVSGTIPKDTYVSLNVVGLINSIVLGAENYISQNEAKIKVCNDEVNSYGSVKIYTSTDCL